MDFTSEQVWTVVGAISAILLGGLGAMWKGSGKVQQLQQMVAGAQAIVDRAQEELKNADELLANMRQKLAATETALVQADLIKQAHIETNAAFESSRDEAWALYLNQSIAAGNAQALLFRELERAVVPLNVMLKERGLPLFQINAQIQHVMQDFKETHVQRSQG